MLPEIWRRGGLMGPTFEDLMERFFYGWPSQEREGITAWTPRADINESDKEISIDLELPGIKKEDIRVEVRNNVVTISGERKQERKTESPEGSRIERHYGKFERSFALPEMVDENKVSASYHDGMLTLRIPKTEKALPKEVKIEVQT
ncbi:MAG: Hsp20/alpha crystallin family protein [Candidatus Latescibacterota bacterium]